MEEIGELAHGINKGKTGEVVMASAMPLSS